MNFIPIRNRDGQEQSYTVPSIQHPQPTHPPSHLRPNPFEPIIGSSSSKTLPALSSHNDVNMNVAFNSSPYSITRTIDVIDVTDPHGRQEDARPAVYLTDRHQTASPRVDENLRHLNPRKPDDGDRYTRFRRAPKGARPGLKISRGPCPVIRDLSLPEGWEEDIHPEGQLLYSKTVAILNRRIRVHTDLALRSSKNHPLITRAMERFIQRAEDCCELQNSVLEDSEIEACILIRECARDEFGYYLVNHRDQTVFWLEDIGDTEIKKMGIWALDPDILTLKLKVQYWRHVTDFPCHCSLSSKVWTQLSPLILVGAVDQEYCEDTTTAPKDGPTLARLEAFWRQAKDLREEDSTRSSCNWICARLWFEIIDTRIANHWGTDYARLERTTKLEDDQSPSEHAAPILIQWICTLLLWNEPAVTMKLLDEAWVGKVIYQKQWRKMMQNFANEWEKIFVLSAIVFAGAMAFLAIPVQSPNNPESKLDSITTSLSFLCGILSCVFSVASLVAAVNLKRDFGGKIAEDVHEAAAYLGMLQSNLMGYLKWGICLSLPRALFQWAVVSFCAGLVILALQLHENRLPFFYSEVAISFVLAFGVVAVRQFSPERFTPESIFKVRRKVRATRERLSTLSRSATAVFSMKSRPTWKATGTMESAAGTGLQLRGMSATGSAERPPVAEV